jgi:hypothetical protein
MGYDCSDCAKIRASPVCNKNVGLERLEDGAFAVKRTESAPNFSNVLPLASGVSSFLEGGSTAFSCPCAPAFVAGARASIFLTHRLQDPKLPL